MQNNIAYSLSACLSDYRIKLDQRICFILSDSLWLGLNINEDDKYYPIHNHYVSFINPQVVENFAINSNCLITSFKCNEKEHLSYAVKRIESNKKVLVKISDKILEDSSVSNSSRNIERPVLACITGLNKSSETEENLLAEDYQVTLFFTENKSMKVSGGEFLKYWMSEKDKWFLTEWHVITPPIISNEPASLRKKLVMALTKQIYLLRPQSAGIYTGSSVLSFLINSLAENDNSAYSDFKMHFQLWENSFREYNETQDFNRMYYAACLEFIRDIIEDDFHKVIESLKKAGELWNLFYFDLKNDLINSESDFLKHYQKLFNAEEMIFNNLKETVDILTYSYEIDSKT